MKFVLFRPFIVLLGPFLGLFYHHFGEFLLLSSLWVNVPSLQKINVLITVTVTHSSITSACQGKSQKDDYFESSLAACFLIDLAAPPRAIIVFSMHSTRAFANRFKFWTRRIYNKKSLVGVLNKNKTWWNPKSAQLTKIGKSTSKYCLVIAFTLRFKVCLSNILRNRVCLTNILRNRVCLSNIELFHSPHYLRGSDPFGR